MKDVLCPLSVEDPFGHYKIEMLLPTQISK